MSDEMKDEDEDDRAEYIGPNEILDYCCNLIVLDETLDIFRMAHLSVREYFEKKTGYEQIQMQTMATHACLNTLLANDALQWTALDGFKVYATVFWPFHCSEIGPDGPSGELLATTKRFLYKDRHGNTVHEASDCYKVWRENVSSIVTAAKRTNSIQYRRISSSTAHIIPTFSSVLPGLCFGADLVVERISRRRRI